MKKEILELVVLGLQTKELFSTENIVNALASLPEKQQHQWIETILSNRQLASNDNPQTDSKQFDSYESESKTDQVDNDDLYGKMCTLKVTLQSCVSKLEIVKYLRDKFDYSLLEARNLIGDHGIFHLPVPLYKSAQITNDLTHLRCNVKQM